MHAATCFVQPIFLTKTAIFIKSTSRTSYLIKTTVSPAAFESLSFNYNSPFSVFLAEACELVGGDACEAVMNPDAKLDTSKTMNEANSNNTPIIQHFDREYFDYNTDPKSVLREEACDDLGGEFCENS